MKVDMRIGDYEVTLIETGDFALDGGAMFGVVPKPLWSKSYNSGDELNRIPMTARCLLAVSDTRKILVDTGCGYKMNPKQQQIYKLDNSVKTLENSLSQLGLTTDDITDVVFTHLHFDHAGGATYRNGNEIVPRFQNAMHYVQKGHLAWARNPSEKDKASFFVENWEPIFANGMLTTLEGNGELFKGISVECFHGHTADLQMVLLRDNQKTIAFPADVLPTSAHIPLPYIMGYDNFPLTTLSEKKELLPRITEEEWIIIFEHDAVTKAGTIVHTEKGYTLGSVIAI